MGEATRRRRIEARARNTSVPAETSFATSLRAEETAAYLAAIVESADDAIVSKTLDGIVTTWNAGAERISWQEPHFHLFVVHIESAALISYGQGQQFVQLWPQGGEFTRPYG
jgi:PAS domain-containing protein